MGRSQKQKGNRVERKIVKKLNDAEKRNRYSAN